jgi:hypothetical protein
MTVVRDIAAVCCYFNPRRYRRRLKNFDVFRRNVERAGIRLLTVELAIRDDPFDLHAYTEVHQIRGGDVMWQKERLLQIGINMLLDGGYEKIAWLDADIVFQDTRWPERVSQALDRFCVVQCFHSANQLYSDGARGVCSALAPPGQFNEIRTPACDGLAWAARGPVLRGAGLYQYCIVGGGDSAFLSGCRYMPGRPSAEQPVLRRRPMCAASPEFVRHYSHWAESLAKIVANSIGHVDQYVVSLAHGAFQNRRYIERQDILRLFDPDEDVRLGPAGVFEWATGKAGLHDAVRRYFLQRAEDT